MDLKLHKLVNFSRKLNIPLNKFFFLKCFFNFLKRKMFFLLIIFFSGVQMKRRSSGTSSHSSDSSIYDPKSNKYDDVYIPIEKCIFQDDEKENSFNLERKEQRVARRNLVKSAAKYIDSKANDAGDDYESGDSENESESSAHSQSEDSSESEYNNNDDNSSLSGFINDESEESEYESSDEEFDKLVKQTFAKEQVSVDFVPNKKSKKYKEKSKKVNDQDSKKKKKIRYDDDACTIKEGENFLKSGVYFHQTDNLKKFYPTRSQSIKCS